MPKKSMQPKANNLNETSLTFRINLVNDKAIGPGKIKLLELINELGSIAAAGKVLKMSYRRAWLLVDDLNHSFKEPLVIAKQGGKGGGNAELTPTAQNIIKYYRLIESEAKVSFASYLTAIEDEISYQQ